MRLAVLTLALGLTIPQFALAERIGIAAELGNCVGGLHVVHSGAGHDGFLTETEPIAGLLDQTMALARTARTTR